MTEEELIELFAGQNLLSSAGETAAGKDRDWTSCACVNAKFLNYRHEFQKTVGKSGMAAMMSEPAPVKMSRGLVKGVQSLFVNQPPNTYDPKLVMDQCEFIFILNRNLVSVGRYTLMKKNGLDFFLL